VAPTYRVTEEEIGTFKTVATPNSSPPAKGSGDYNDTLVQKSRRTRGGLRRPTANINKETTAN
jgi:hypothetical protein